MSPEPENTKSLRFARYKDRGEFVFAAVLTAYGVFGYYVIRDQLRVMQQQADLMRAQLVDARKAAADSDKVTARTLAALEEQADASKTLADASKTMAEAAKRSAESSAKIAEATMRQLATLESQAASLVSQAESMRGLTEANNVIAGAANRSAETSAKLADAAREANTVSRDFVATTQHVQRAFVFVNSLTIRRLVEAPAPLPIFWRAYIEFENAGNTPTKDLIVRSNCAEVPHDYSSHDVEPDVFKVDHSNKTLWRTPPVAALLGPRQSIYVETCFVRPMDVMLGMGHRFYIWGTAEYRDILNPSRAHRTEFCFHVDIVGDLETLRRDVPGKKMLATENTPCRQHNCADEECEKGDSKPPSQPGTPPAIVPGNG